MAYAAYLLLAFGVPMDRPKATDRQEHPRRRPTDKWPAAKTPPSHDAKAEPKKEISKEAGLTADRKRSTYSPEKVQKKNAHITARREQQEETTYATQINKENTSNLDAREV
jgi:hypothetical protein